MSSFCHDVMSNFSVADQEVWHVYRLCLVFRRQINKSSLSSFSVTDQAVWHVYFFDGRSRGLACLDQVFMS